MSFKCQNCGKAQPDGSKPTKVVTETRSVTYPRTPAGLIPTGTEIVKEVDLCKNCHG